MGFVSDTKNSSKNKQKTRGYASLPEAYPLIFLLFNKLKYIQILFFQLSNHHPHSKSYECRHDPAEIQFKPWKDFSCHCDHSIQMQKCSYCLWKRFEQIKDCCHHRKYRYTAIHDLIMFKQLTDQCQYDQRNG